MLISSAVESAAESQEQPPRQKAPQVEENDLRSEASAKPVVPLAGHGNESDAGASEEAEEQHSAAPPPPPDSGENVGSPRPRAARAKRSTYYRTVRALAVMNVVSILLLTCAVIVLARMFTNSTERQQASSQQHELQLTRDAAERLDARDLAHAAELRRVEESVRQRTDELAETVKNRFDAFDKRLDLFDRPWLTGALAQMIPRAKGELQVNLLNFARKVDGGKVKRSDLIEEGNRLLPTIKDKQMRKEFKEKVMDVLQQKVQATD